MQARLGQFGFGCVATVAATLIGCNTAEPPAFRLNMASMVSSEIGPEYQQEIADVLAALFGTPDDPYAVPESGLDNGKLRMAAGPAWTNEKGANYGLYRKHCVHCHGITGDGRGPTARFLNPYPRDYRPAVYKFKSTYRAQMPTDHDLLTILKNGVPGTAMPSFAVYPGSELEALVEYVKYLSIRGQMERRLVEMIDGELREDDDGNRIPLDPANSPDIREFIMADLAEIVEAWETASENVIVPDDSQTPPDDRTPEQIAASVAKGRELFYGAKANCMQCHGPTALGDGQQNDHTDWQKEHKAFIEETDRLAVTIADRASQDLDEAGERRLDNDRAELARRQEVAATLYPVRNAIPRNLRQGIYRGGRRPIDVFWRISAGVAGAPMPGVGPAGAGAKGTITDAEIWNIVDYVMSLPYETPSKPRQSFDRPKLNESISSH